MTLSIESINHDHEKASFIFSLNDFNFIFYGLPSISRNQICPQIQAVVGSPASAPTSPRGIIYNYWGLREEKTCLWLWYGYIVHQTMSFDKVSITIARCIF